MAKSVCQWLSAAAVLLMASAGWAQLAQDIADQVTGGVPVVGLDIGAALPISGLRSTADPGGSVSPWVGWQIGKGTGFTLTPLAEFQYTGFTRSSSNNDGSPGFTSLGAGARASLNEDAAEIYFGAGGGYYWSTNHAQGDGGGFDINGGVNYEFWRGTALGIFGRYDQLSVDSTPSDDQTKFLTTGLEVRHRFLPEPPPPPAPAPPPPPPPAAPVKKKIVLRGVNFDFDRYDIRPDAVPILEEAAKTLKAESDLTVSVNGYTDAIGSAEYNQRLSERRANAVRAYLEKLGVAGSRLTARGFGKSNPVASNDTAEGRAQNRRVELVVNP